MFKYFKFSCKYSNMRGYFLWSPVLPSWISFPVLHTWYHHSTHTLLNRSAQRRRSGLDLQVLPEGRSERRDCKVCGVLQWGWASVLVFVTGLSQLERAAGCQALLWPSVHSSVGCCHKAVLWYYLSVIHSPFNMLPVLIWLFPQEEPKISSL